MTMYRRTMIALSLLLILIIAGMWIFGKTRTGQPVAESGGPETTGLQGFYDQAFDGWSESDVNALSCEMMSEMLARNIMTASLEASFQENGRCADYERTTDKDMSDEQN